MGAVPPKQRSASDDKPQKLNIAVLGISNSGQNSLMRKMKMTHGSNYKFSERKKFRKYIVKNALEYLNYIANPQKQHQIGDTINVFHDGKWRPAEILEFGSETRHVFLKFEDDDNTRVLQVILFGDVVYFGAEIGRKWKSLDLPYGVKPVFSGKGATLEQKRGGGSSAPVASITGITVCLRSLCNHIPPDLIRLIAQFAQFNTSELQEYAVKHINADDVEYLWDHPWIQYFHRKNKYLSSSPNPVYFLEQFQKFHDPLYIATDEDILRIELPSDATIQRLKHHIIVQQTVIEFERMLLSRNKNSKRFKLLKYSDAVLFLVNISQINDKFEEKLKVFQKTARFFKKIPIFLIFTSTEILQQRLFDESLEMDPLFGGGDMDFEQICSLTREKFLRCCNNGDRVVCRFVSIFELDCEHLVKEMFQLCKIHKRRRGRTAVQCGCGVTMPDFTKFCPDGDE